MYQSLLICVSGRDPYHASVEFRYYVDPETALPHIYRHGLDERDVEDVLRRPMEDRPGRDGSRVALGRTQAGRYLRVVYVPDTEEIMRSPTYPEGWDEERVRRVLEHYDTQSDDEAVAEDEAAYETITHTAMEVPVDLVPAVRELIARRRV